MRKQLRDIINQQNALRSTTSQKSARPYPRNAEAERSAGGQGPRTAAGKQRSSLNAFKHGLSGNHFAMQQHEFAAYENLTERMLRDLKPVTEPEKQIAQKIIDLNFRINRITAIENNLLNFDMGPNEPALEEDEGIARMMGQARAWKQDAHAFEILGRYEARLSKQLLQYQNELERLKTVRKAETAAAEKVSQTEETTPLNPASASFGKPAPTYINHAAAAIPEIAPLADPTLPASHPEGVAA